MLARDLASRATDLLLGYRPNVALNVSVDFTLFCYLRTNVKCPLTPKTLKMYV